jgi:hypothetical protein
MHESQKPGQGLVLGEAEYRQLVLRFDRLWNYATSEHDQREMQHLIGLIDAYEEAVSA